MLKIKKLDEVWAFVECEPGQCQEISDLLTFEVPGAKFMPSYRKRYWDGKIRLYDAKKSRIYTGLHTKMRDFALSNNYDIEVDEALLDTDEISIAEARGFAKSLHMPIEPRDYQLQAFSFAVRNRRAVLVSPTGSGKSLIAYLIARWYNQKTLIVVPTVSLVMQMAKDFEEYGYDKEVHGIMAGVEKTSATDITVSTWQSIYEQKKPFFKNYKVIIGDEAHLFKAKSLTSIMTKMPDTPYRFGMTGTLDGAEVHELVLEGLFGPIEKVVDTSTLIDDKNLADLKIKILVLSHPKEIRKDVLDGDYQNELEAIVTSDARNKFIKNLALSLKGNTLILYALVEKHGKQLFEIINDATEQNVFFVSGGVEAQERERVRQIVEQSDDSIIVASYGTFSTGINIRNLHNVIFASPTKSRIRTLQSIGRGLRTSDTKSSCTLFDIADDFSTKNRKNYTLNHLMERVKMYNSEAFPYKLYNIKLRTTDETVLF